MPHRHVTKYLAAAVLLAFSLTACDRLTVYHHYEHTPADGWERTDTLCFQTPPVTASGTYIAEVGVRTNAAYPFRNLSLVVTQTLPARQQHSDTLDCILTDQQGRATGSGVSVSQQQYSLGRLQLAKGDSVRFTVCHQMRREKLAGITDVGLRITKATN